MHVFFHYYEMESYHLVRRLLYYSNILYNIFTRFKDLSKAQKDGGVLSDKARVRKTLEYTASVNIYPI